MKKNSVSLIITTYNSPNFLKLCLKSIEAQTITPHEILIADDGSKDETKQLIEGFKVNSNLTIHHVWHEDDGYRLSKIRNKAIKQSSGNYIIQIDGDVILHKKFIADHLYYAKKNRFLSGKRVNINQKLTEKLIENQSIHFPFYFNSNLSKKMKGLRLNFLSNLAYIFSNSSKKYKYVLGCNMSFWKDDLIEVNGYNEDFVGWGKEDNDISVRLINAKKKLMLLTNTAIVYHLYHPENDRGSHSFNEKLYFDSINSKIIRVTNGIFKERNIF